MPGQAAHERKPGTDEIQTLGRDNGEHVKVSSHNLNAAWTLESPFAIPVPVQEPQRSNGQLRAINGRQGDHHQGHIFPRWQEHAVVGIDHHGTAISIFVTKSINAFAFAQPKAQRQVLEVITFCGWSCPEQLHLRI
jgi:hypothetical protein